MRWTGAIGAAVGLGGAGALVAPPQPARAASAGPTVLTAEQDAARFLAQCAFGGDRDLIDAVVAAGPINWLSAQFTLPPSLTFDVVDSYGPDSEEQFAHFDWTWWTHALSAPDMVRQRVAFALSQIFVISRQQDALFDSGRGAATYHDLMVAHAFGNFRDLLYAVTLHPFMGKYLSHANNRRSDPTANRFPDENYAREVMQLFTIGLFKLNPDGTPQRGPDGQPIPTYGNAEITEMAKIFTGLTYAPDNPDDPVVFGEYENLILPMVMVESEHEPGPKTLLDGFVVPAGQTGLEDIASAIDHLFQHPNVGPFIGRQLIQRLVTSNPTPAYVARVAARFNDNGFGVRGDMRAVIQAIVFDPEARDASRIDDPTFGKVREPLVRWIHLGRAFHASSDSDQFRHFGADTPEVGEEGFGELVPMAQYPYFSPSVFNFYSPSHQPAGPLTDADLVAPELEIVHAYTAIATINHFDRALVADDFYILDTFEQIAWLDLDTEIDVLLDSGPVGLLDHLDLLLTYGTLGAVTRQAILDAILPLSAPEEQVQLALYLLAISPDAAVLR
ncbi:MAG: DUF1800 family protein [Acidobacteriota bacterium]